jgi:hypothetical protein
MKKLLFCSMLCLTFTFLNAGNTKLKAVIKEVINNPGDKEMHKYATESVCIMLAITKDKPKEHNKILAQLFEYHGNRDIRVVIDTVKLKCPDNYYLCCAQQ